MSYPGVSQPLTGSSYPVIGPPVSTGLPPTDAELAAKDVPPLRNGYDPGVAGQPPLSQRAQTELELSALESSYSGWVGGIAFARYRSGTPGFDRLTDLESPFEVSGVLGKTLRATVVPLAVFLNSGTVDTASFQNSTGVIPVLGTLSGAAAVTPPQQFASGVGGEFQLTTQNMGAAVGYTPYGFLVTNVTARGQWRPAGGHFTFFGDRDSVKDTQLSYAGLRDPGSASAIYEGNIWGGVIATGGGVRVDMGNERAGLYISGDGADLTGYHVLENRKYEGIDGGLLPREELAGVWQPEYWRQLLRHALPVQRARDDLRAGRLLQPERVLPRRHSGRIHWTLQTGLPLHASMAAWVCRRSKRRRLRTIRWISSCRRGPAMLLIRRTATRA